MKGRQMTCREKWVMFTYTGKFVRRITKLFKDSNIRLQFKASWEANSRSTGRENPWLLWNSNGHYHVHKSPPLVPVLSQMNPVTSFLSHVP